MLPSPLHTLTAFVTGRPRTGQRNRRRRRTPVSCLASSNSSMQGRTGPAELASEEQAPTCLKPDLQQGMFHSSVCIALLYSSLFTSSPPLIIAFCLLKRLLGEKARKMACRLRPSRKTPTNHARLLPPTGADILRT